MHQPFEVPANFMIGGERTSTNVFVLENIGSKYVMLNRPEALNALTLEMVRELQKVYNDIEDAHMIGMVLLHGAGEKAFCAGGDVLSLVAPGPIPMDKEAPQMQFFREEYTLNHRIATAPKTTVSILQGYTMGGGVGISAHGHWRVAMPDTVWSMPETAIGFFPDVGSSYFMPRTAHEGAGVYLGLTGKKINCTEALALGIATHHIEFGMQHWMMDRLLSVNEGFDDPEFVDNLLMPHHVAPEASDHVSPHLDAIRRCFGPQHASVQSIIDAVKQTHGKGGADAKWAEETLALLNKASPTSLAVTLEAMLRGAQAKSLRECLEMEFRMARCFLSKPDFFEGVRAALVDKDHAPNWAPAPTPAQVEEYFAPLRAEPELQLTYKPRAPLSEKDRGGAPRRLNKRQLTRVGRD